MRNGGLTTARDIEEQVESFEHVRSYLGNRLRINNIAVVEDPDWVYDLFSGGMPDG